MSRRLTLAGLILVLVFSGCQSRRTKSGNQTDSAGQHHSRYTLSFGAITRGDTLSKKLALVFTGDEFADGGETILQVLTRQQVKASFFLTGRFYRNPEFAGLVTDLTSAGHYLGAHSDQHLLYCTWSDRDSLLVTREEFERDLKENYRAFAAYGISKNDAGFFLPPYEWYNDSIGAWTGAMDLVLINHTPGTLSAADYTLPEKPGYRSNQEIYKSILTYEETDPNGLNGFILLTHMGTHPDRTEKFYHRLEELMEELKKRGYGMVRIDELLKYQTP
jgi:peptidoglycan/xylan/chitin deacetylase (PgdA/CDA1 family)